jgi:hypothetical protein
MLHFAVFGDVHGRIALMMTIARLWEHHGARRLSGVLQVGDMGAFPDHTRLDEATARMARDDADELGFASFCTPTDEGERYLGDGAPPSRSSGGTTRTSTTSRPSILRPWTC